jgi:hypothetical protein
MKKKHVNFILNSVKIKIWSFESLRNINENCLKQEMCLINVKIVTK